jgi:transposase
MLFPVDMREWVRADDVVHLVIEAVEQMDLREAEVNERGTGSAQYPPGMMLGLLIYCYAQGRYSSRKIEQATYSDVAVRYLTADTHPDHDTIATFRRTQERLLRRAFVEVLQLARRMGMPQLGTVCLDGTKLRANASMRANRREAELRAELAALDKEVAGRLQQAKAAELEETGEQLPAELANPAVRRARLAAARAALHQRAAEQERPPRDSDSGNTTDPDSRPQYTSHGSIQGYNAQLAVSAESGLIVAAHVSTETQDRRQLIPTVEAIPAQAGQPHTVVADTGYDNHEQIVALAERTKAAIYIPPQLPVETTGRQKRAHVRRSAERRERLERVRSAPGQALMRLRRITVEPIFGTLKSARGFGRFHLRGLGAVNLEWILLCTAFNLRRLHGWNARATA